MNSNFRPTYVSFLFVAFLSFAAAYGHCDRLDGPVAKAAIQALESGDFQTVQIWVGPEHEQELRRAYDNTVVVRSESKSAQELADRYFIETAVRLHRQAEGMSFTGVKPAGLPVPPDVQAADRAIEEDNVEPLIELLNTRLRQHILDLHQNVVQARPADAGDVDAGRRWVDHYVRFIVYSHGLYQAIDAGPEHGLAH